MSDVPDGDVIRPWELLQSNFVLDHPWYRVRRDAVRLPDGREIDDYFISIRPEVVLVFPVTSKGEVVLVRQYKHGAGEILLEFPGGILNDPQEPPLEAARRELEEETGYQSETLHFLTTVWDDPAKQNNRLHLFLAEDCRLSGEQHLDTTEFIEVVHVPLEELRSQINDGLVKTGGAIALAWHAFARLSR